MAAKKKAEEAAEDFMPAPATVEEAAESAEKPAEKKVEQKFSKSKLVGSKRFVADKSILAAKLDEKKRYSVGECEKIIDEYKRKEVK